MIGWQRLGYPGPLMSYRDEIGKQNGERPLLKPKSLAEVVGHPVAGWEDEKS